MSARAKRRTSGFTLIEIMVALFLLGLVVAAVYSSWTAIVRGSKAGLTAAAAVQRSRIAVRTVEEALNSARSFADSVQYYSFYAENGDDASLSFVAHLAKSFPRGGKFGDLDVRRVTFSLEPAADSGRQLVLRQNPILMDLDIDEKEHPVVLAKNVKKFEMEFWDKRYGDWTDEWTQTNQLPQMVKVTLQFAGEGATSAMRDEVTKVISLPAPTVQSVWQAPGLPTRPPTGAPGVVQPGQIPSPPVLP